jgi:hypothetical protein
LGCSQSLNATVITSYAAPATTDNCTNGILVGKYCVATSSVPATVSCPTGYTFDGIACTSSSTQPGTGNYTCPTGQTPVGSGANMVCQSDSLPATTAKACTATAYATQGDGQVPPAEVCIAPCPAGTISGFPYTAPIAFSNPTPVSGYCPPFTKAGGQKCNYPIAYNGLACVAPISCPFGTTPVTGTYYGPHGTMYIRLCGPAPTPIYTCPIGFTGPVGTSTPPVCIPPTTVATITTYSCPGGVVQNGSTCTVTSTATTTFGCLPGQKLSGTNCFIDTSTPATVNYSCTNGSTPVNGLCIIKSIQTSWADTCVPYETSAGSMLPTP